MRSLLDTNVVVYAFDVSEPAKQRVAVEILGGEDRLVISTQVLLETWWTLTRKIPEPLSEETASEVVDQLCRLPVVRADAELVTRAIRAARGYRIAVWDAMIVEAARSGGCVRILTEDLQHGRDFDGVVVENPFVDVEESGTVRRSGAPAESQRR